MLISSSGLTLATHYCGGRAVKSELKIGQSELRCGMSINSSAENGCNEKKEIKRNCCRTEFLTMDLDDEIENDFLRVSVNHHFLQSFVQVFIVQPVKVAEKQEVFVYASPPPKKQNRQVLFQSFLI